MGDAIVLFFDQDAAVVQQLEEWIDAIVTEDRPSRGVDILPRLAHHALRSVAAAHCCKDAYD